jgi:hypothetical protein
VVELMELEAENDDDDHYLLEKVKMMYIFGYKNVEHNILFWVLIEVEMNPNFLLIFLEDETHNTKEIIIEENLLFATSFVVVSQYVVSFSLTYFDHDLPIDYRHWVNLLYYVVDQFLLLKMKKKIPCVDDPHEYTCGQWIEMSRVVVVVVVGYVELDFHVVVLIQPI